MGIPERHTLAHEQVREIGRRREVAAKGGRHAVTTEVSRRDHFLERREKSYECVDGIEQWLLVLLHVLVIRERNPLHNGEERQEITEDTASLAPRELRHVGILLLRHDAASGRDAVVQLDKCELPTAPEN